MMVAFRVWALRVLALRDRGLGWCCRVLSGSIRFKLGLAGLYRASQRIRGLSQ